jgi:HD-GYP domain-containing protein (c-di-GMP phosphodiesterase class II)
MKTESRPIRIPIFDMILCLSNAIDLVSPAVVDHHKRVAYIASVLSAESGLSPEDQIEMMTAGALHDVGALSLGERIETLAFELTSPHGHGETGYLLLRDFGPLSRSAVMIRHHHVPWNWGEGRSFRGNPVPLGSHMLHLADRIDVLTEKRSNILEEAGRICEKIEGESGKLFMPELVKAFLNAGRKESFWLDIVFPGLGQLLARKARDAAIELDLDGLLGLARLFGRLIDFRSRFTAVHSSGVAACAKTLAGLCGFSEQQCHLMEIAGYLHDIGKLAVPREILESPKKLAEEEFRIVKGHTFYTCRILEGIPGLEVVTGWASLHHERLEGKGYPFHYTGKDLPLGSRIMSVADVFTAVTEDRPYREGMNRNEALGVLRGMAETSHLDSKIVSVLTRNYEKINSIRISSQFAARKEYERFSRDRGQFIGQ